MRTDMDTLTGEITQLLDEWSAGKPGALGRLLPLVLDRVRELAARALSGEKPLHTLQPTALVNEVYIRLIGRRDVQWQSREQLFGYLAKLMRHILVDHARRHLTQKRGGDVVLVPLEDIDVPTSAPPEVLAVHDALKDLTALAPRQARIVELKYFMGLTKKEIAEVLGISEATVEREWKKAKDWLWSYLSPEEPEEP